MPIQRMLPELPGPFEASDEPSGNSPAQWARLVLGAAMRRKLLALALFSMGIAALGAYYRSRTPLYLVEAKILVQRTAYSSNEDPARSAAVLVHRRESLVDLIKQTDLLAGGGAARPARPRWPSWVPSLAKRTASTNDPIDWLVWKLDRALKVTTGYDGTINISLEWPNPEEAYRLVEAAQQNFLEARHLQEITATDEVISILQGRTAMLREQVDRAIQEAQRDLTRTPAPARSSEGAANPSAPRSDPAAARAKAEELVALKSKLDAKERAIADVEDFRRHRLADLMAQLDEKRAMYSDTYPGVVALRQDIQSLSRESPQVIGLREEARKLREQYTERMAKQDPNEGATAALALLAATRADRPDRAMSGLIIEQDERVREARARYASMLDRLNMAQLERDSARAAFKHRYNVAWPAEVPREPFSPKPLKILGLGSVAVLLIALLCAAAPDLWSGKIIQRWQIERSLELPVLAELDRK